MLRQITHLWVVMLVLGASSSFAQTPYNDPKTAEGWAWQQIRNDDIADLAARIPPGSATSCGPLDLEKPPPNNDCHVISAQFLVDALTDPKLQAQVGRHGFRLRNAQLGPIDLSDVKVPFALWIDASRIDGKLDLDDSQFEKLASFEGTKIAGGFHAERAKFDNIVLLRFKATVDGDVDLNAATIGSNLEMTDSSFAGKVNLGRAEIKGLSLLRNATFGGDVTFRGATAGNNFEMDGSSFAGEVDFNSALIKGSLFLRDKATFGGDVDLGGATVESALDMSGSSFAGKVILNRTEIKGGLFLRNGATFGGDIDLGGTTVGSNVEMEGSSFAGTVELDGAQIKGGLYLWDATVAGLDLSRAEIGELDLPRLGWRCPRPEPPAGAPAKDVKADAEPSPMHWPLGNLEQGWRKAQCDDGAAAPNIDLRNTHVGALQDSSDAWPPVIYLEGFHYDRLGSAGGEMHQRSSSEWTEWIERNPSFSTQPYTQLSSVLLAAGDRGKAEAIQFAGREAERHHEPDWLTWAWLTVLAGVAGYGIGLYTFFVLGWVLLLTAVGAVLLWLSPQARAHRFVWRLGASLHRVLPVIELSKDYTDFFDGLSQEPIVPLWRKHVLQVYFAGHAIAGYVLGFFLIAAMGGLTQKG
jgi:hypothetical protein